MTHTDSNRFLSDLGKNPAGVRAKPWTAGRPLRARSRMHHARAKPSAQGGDECTVNRFHDTKGFPTPDTGRRDSGKIHFLLRINCICLVFFFMESDELLLFVSLEPSEADNRHSVLNAPF